MLVSSPTAAAAAATAATAAATAAVAKEYRRDWAAVAQVSRIAAAASCRYPSTSY
jgi:hypothetical protein